MFCMAKSEKEIESIGPEGRCFENGQCDVFGFLIIYIFLIKLEKVNKHLSFPGFFLEKPNLLKSVTVEGG